MDQPLGDYHNSEANSLPKFDIDTFTCFQFNLALSFFESHRGSSTLQFIGVGWLVPSSEFRVHCSVHFE